MQSDYEKARKDGERAYRRAVMSGQYPYLPALDSMGQDIDRLAVRDLGVEEVPISMIAGTRTVGRQNAFACNFMPITEPGSEFAWKWLFDSGNITTSNSLGNIKYT